MGGKQDDTPRPGPDHDQQDPGRNPEQVIPRHPAWNFNVGWANQTTPPQLADLLPLDVQQQFLEIWLHTGTNLLYSKALETLIDFREKPGFHREVFESMEGEMMDVMHFLSAKWDAEEAMGRRAE